MNAPLPHFPNFESLKLEHRAAVEALTTKSKPYSDFNFTNLFIWNIDGTTMISVLNNNLVVRIMNYAGEYLVLTLDGNNKLEETVDTLLGYAAAQPDLSDTLEYVHEDVARQLNANPAYIVSEERHNFDYIITLSSETNLSGRKNKSRRKLIRQFEAKYGKTSSVRLLDINDAQTQKQIIDLFETWAKDKKLRKQDINDEKMALERLFILPDSKINITAIYNDEILIGFTADELCDNKYALGHFMKADTSYVGAFQYLEYQAALNLIESGMEYINIEQDLGIEQLRLSKLSHHPHELLKKFSISRVNSN